MNEEVPEKRAEDAPGNLVFTEKERLVLDFLSSCRRVDARWLSDEQKGEIRTVLDELHNLRMLSLLRISREVGKSYTAIWGLYRALEIKTRNVAESQRVAGPLRSKHPRRSFDGTEKEKAYLRGFTNGDLTARQVSGTAVMVSSTTTHPAFAELFGGLFAGYGPLYEYPMFEEGRGYKWKVAARLDNSFQFLITGSEENLRSYRRERKCFLQWLAGLVDSDGNVRVGHNQGYVRAFLAIYSTNRDFLVSLKEAMQGMGYSLDGPYLGAKKGFTTRAGITYRKDFWNVALQQTSEVQRLLQELELRHREKIERKRLVLSLNTTMRWNGLEARVAELKSRFQSEVSDYVAKAEAIYKANKEKKSRARNERIES